MLRPTAELDEVERRYARHWNAHATYDDALAVFKALWTEACTSDPTSPSWIGAAISSPTSPSPEP